MQPHLTLIQLISGESLQNVLPVLALKPNRVISLVSKETPMFLKRKCDIENAVRLAWPLVGDGATFPSFDTAPETLDSDSPSIHECNALVSKLIANSMAPCVNYTGGTKDMSIGAWTAAQSASAPTVYCDSPRAFRSGGTCSLEFPIQLPELARRLNVPAILAAQGFLRNEHWKVYKTSGAQIAFGRISFELLREEPATIHKLQRYLLEHGNAGNKKRPNRDDLYRVENVPLSLNEAGVITQFLDAACRAHLLVKRRDGWFINVPRDGIPKSRLERLDRILMQLSGGAYEGFIHDCLEKTERFTAFLHGVMPATSSEDSTFGETDFLAFEPGKVRLVLISCKSSPPSLEHLEATLTRKSHFGGRFAHAMLCIKSVPNPKRESEIRRQTHALGIECLIGNEVEKAFGLVT